MPDDHSEVVPLLPIPNRTVKRLCADDSAGSRVKVGHRQALIARRPVYGRGVSISTLKKSVDGSAETVLESKASLIVAELVGEGEMSILLGLLGIVNNIQPISVGV